MASRSSNKARALLLQLRQSQCLEVFITERLLMASKGFLDKDDFERKVSPLSSQLCLISQWVDSLTAGTACCFHAPAASFQGLCLRHLS